MSHPSLHYIKFLLAQGWNDEEPQSLTTINASLRHLHLFPLGEDAYNDILLAFAPPADFDFDDHKQAATRAFMREERIEYLWDGKRPDVQGVLDVLMPLHTVRERLDLLLLGKAPSDFAAKWASRWAMELPHIGHTGEITEKMVDVYRHYFVHPWVCSLAQWQELLRGHPMEDPMLASLQHGADAARFWAGLPVKLRRKQAPLEDALAQLHQRLLSLRLQPTTKATVDSEVKITAAIERLHERLYGSSESNAAEQLMELYKHIKMETVPVRHPTIEELTANGGTYSGCGH